MRWRRPEYRYRQPRGENPGSPCRTGRSRQELPFLDLSRITDISRTSGWKRYYAPGLGTEGIIRKLLRGPGALALLVFLTPVPATAQQQDTDTDQVNNGLVESLVPAGAQEQSTDDPSYRKSIGLTKIIVGGVGVLFGGWMLAHSEAFGYPRWAQRNRARHRRGDRRWQRVAHPRRGGGPKVCAPSELRCLACRRTGRCCGWVQKVVVGDSLRRESELSARSVVVGLGRCTAPAPVDATTSRACVGRSRRKRQHRPRTRAKPLSCAPASPLSGSRS